MTLRRVIRRILDRMAKGAGYRLVPRDEDRFGFSLGADLRRLAGPKPLGCIFDVGANIGQFARRMRSSFPEAVIHSFEPIEDSFHRLEREFAGDARFHAHRLALGPERRRRRMFLYPQSVMNTFIDRPSYDGVVSEATGGTVDVEMTTLDDFCEDQGIRCIDLLKVDTEGFDLEVLRGGGSVLTDNRVRYIQVEFFRLRDDDGKGGSLAEIDEFLRPLGYAFVTVYTNYVLPQRQCFGVHDALFASIRPSP